MDIKSLEVTFFEKFGNRNDRPVLFFSPGRVNLIGEHTDYNGGFVFPCALNYGTYLLIRKRKDNLLKFKTLNFNADGEKELNGLFANTGNSWINYPLGVINEFIKNNIEITGLEFLYYGDVPNSAGLSSSASIEMVTAVALNDLFHAGVTTLELVKLSQRAENEFVGMNCGIMDQFAVGFGKKDHAIFLNCDTLHYENVPFNLGDCSLLITNTNKSRGLTDSKYNERRRECDKAVELLQLYKPVRNLSQIQADEINILERYIKVKTPGSEAQARQLVNALHQAAQDLPFKELGQVVELSGQQSDPDKRQREDPLRWLLIQAAQSVEFKPKGWGRDQGYSSWFNVPPSRLIAFTAWPGEGCESSNFGLCQYPAVIESCYGPLKTGLSGWSWSSFVKSQYASNPQCGGVPNFLQCHLTVIAMLDKAKELGCLECVSDEGGFWDKRDLPALVQEIGSWNEMIAAFGGKLKDLLGDGPVGLESAIAQYPNFEQLEAAGQSKLPAGLEKLARLIGRVGAQMPTPGQASAPAPAAC